MAGSRYLVSRLRRGSQALLSRFQMKANGFSAAKLGLSVERPTAWLAKLCLTAHCCQLEGQLRLDTSK
jgi:hypothetical protein